MKYKIGDIVEVQEESMDDFIGCNYNQLIGKILTIDSNVIYPIEVEFLCTKESEVFEAKDLKKSNCGQILYGQ